MQAFAGVALAAAVLLMVAAPGKLARPAPSIGALRSVGLTAVGPKVVRGLTGLELAAGIGAVIVGGRLTDGAVAFLYLGFSGFLILVLFTVSAISFTKLR